MKTRGRVRVAVGACVLGFVAFTFVAPAAAQQKAQPAETKKLDKAQLQEAQALTEALDAAIAGKPAPSDIPVKLDNFFFFRAFNGQTYIPFQMVFDPSSVASPDIAFAIRAVKKSMTPATQPTADKGAKPAPPAAAYQDLEFTTLKADGTQAKVSRALQVPGGDYDLWIGVKEKNPADKKQKAKIAVYRQDLKVPDYGQAVGFATSTLVVTDTMDQIPAALKPEQQRDNPYTMGQLQIVPKTGTTFAKNQELCIYFQIYNAGLDSANKPDVLVEYEFYQKQAGGAERKIFNADPQVLNAGTLPKEFDANKHLLTGPDAWPLSSFPVGDYKLNVKVTDKVSGKAVTHTVNFSVTAAS